MRLKSIYSLLPLLALAMGQSFIIQPGKGGKARATKTKAEDPKKDEECEGEEDDDEEEVPPPADGEEDSSEGEGDGEEAPPADGEEDDSEEDDDKTKATAKKQSKIARALNSAWMALGIIGGPAKPKAAATAADTAPLTAEITKLKSKLATAQKTQKQTETLLAAAGIQHTALCAVLTEKLGIKGDITATNLAAALDSTIQKETARDIAKAGVPVRKLPKANADESTGYPTHGTTAEQVAWVRKNRKAKAKASGNNRAA